MELALVDNNDSEEKGTDAGQEKRAEGDDSDARMTKLTEEADHRRKLVDTEGVLSLEHAARNCQVMLRDGPVVEVIPLMIPEVSEVVPEEDTFINTDSEIDRNKMALCVVGSDATCAEGEITHEERPSKWGPEETERLAILPYRGSSGEGESGDLGIWVAELVDDLQKSESPFLWQDDREIDILDIESPSLTVSCMEPLVPFAVEREWLASARVLNQVDRKWICIVAGESIVMVDQVKIVLRLQHD
ncbi:hypothetical protein CBR_g57064 [Chara braunii]|uniref:Uncharacterized protein n=1 Tax=Chara braunii TaxID=69332 RepID=A0A388K7Z5_CHABU|nr:hypothetical protein CBR_g57064 [Chara braunii]|eukprot:GBG66182.1 hypothetical protein CBR_g57064 [Chara braunii]